MKEQDRGTQENFRLNIIAATERSTDPEVRAALDWYQERLKALPEMRTSEFNLTDGEKWKYNTAENGQVKDVVGAQFSVVGKKVEANFSWNQPLIRQKSETAIGADGKEVKISGIVILVKDQKGRFLLSVQNEPGVDSVNIEGKEKHPVVRTPVQTSVVKLQQLEQGEEKVDPVLFQILKSFAAKGKTIKDVIRELPLRKVATDGNRMESNVYYGELVVDEKTAKELEEKTGGKFLTRKQISFLNTVNGHTHVALSVNSK